jgi:2-oxoglutarate ferredoxin oxidoreductase subunit delta
VGCVNTVSAIGTVAIDAARCKGCELCIPACPVGVLRMSPQRNQKGYFVPELLDGCTGCTACQLVCPDFVFAVYKFTPVVSIGEG